MDVKICDKPLKPDKIKGSSILIGSVTDAYNPFEKKYQITRKIVGELAGLNAKIEILTKSDLIVRDIDVLKQIPDIRVGFSINSLDDSFCKKTEPFAASVSKRVNAMKTLHDAGIRTYLFMSPIFPGITQYMEIIEKVKPFADSYYFENLNLRGGYLSRVLKFIAVNYPEHNELYENIYKKKDMTFWESVGESITMYCKNTGLDYKLYFYHEQIKKGAR